jgi:hypothetical protein
MIPLQQKINLTLPIKWPKLASDAIISDSYSVVSDTLIDLSLRRTRIISITHPSFFKTLALARKISSD